MLRFRSVLHIGAVTCLSLGGLIEAAEKTLCQPDEAVYFSCALKKSTKIVSICGSKELDAKTGYLQYRFGRSGKIELQYPSEHTNSQQAFKYSFYTRAQVSRYSVSFVNSGTTYEVVNNYEGDVDPKILQVGVVVTLKNQQEREFSCEGEPTGNFSQLRDVVPCDSDSALNMGGCPQKKE